MVYIIFNLRDLHHRTSRTDFLSRFINRGTHIAAFRAQRRTFFILREAQEVKCARGDIRNFMQPHYILLCVCASKMHRQMQLYRFLWSPCCIPDAHVRFSKVDTGFFSVPRVTVPWANRYMYTVKIPRIFKSNDRRPRRRFPPRNEISRETADKVRAFLLERKRNSCDVTIGAFESRWIPNVPRCNP